MPLYIDKKSETLKIIQQLRDEAHRFGITHHRKRREKGTIKSELTAIEGIGFSTAQKLLWKFRSVKKIKSATEEELAAGRRDRQSQSGSGLQAFSWMISSKIPVDRVARHNATNAANTLCRCVVA